MWSNNSFIQILREFYAKRCHVELPVTSLRERESDITTFYTPAPLSYLRPCNINKSHDTMELGLGLIGPNLDIFS